MRSQKSCALILKLCAHCLGIFWIFCARNGSIKTNYGGIYAQLQYSNLASGAKGRRMLAQGTREIWYGISDIALADETR